MRHKVIGVLIAAVLAGDVLRIVTHSSIPPVDVHWDKRVVDLVAFVEKERGLRFKHAVPVRFLDDAAFEKTVAPEQEETKEDKEDLEKYVGQFRALGLLRGPVDLADALDDLVSASVIGLYKPDDEAVYVRGTAVTPAVRGTLVHELTHVLQDQHFDIEKLQEDAPGDDTTAVTALIEGDAVRIEEAYRDQLSRAELEEYRKEQQEGRQESVDRSKDIPAILSDFLGFPYVFGPVLLDSLTAEDGNEEVNRAFRHPPTAEAQVLDPAGHPFDEDPVEVKEPTLPAGAERLDDPGPFGQVFLFDVLGSQLGYQAAWEAVQGWQGDRFVGYRSGGKVCAAADIAMDGDEAVARLTRTAQRWAQRLSAATVTSRDGLVEIRSCDPGTAGAPLPKQDPSAFDVLLVRMQLLHEFSRSGAEYPAAVCVADAVVFDAARDGYRDLTSEAPDAAAIAHFQQVANAAVDRCRAATG